MLEARLLTPMCLIVWVLWKIPASAYYVERVIAGFLFFITDALQGYIRCAAAIVGGVGIISKITMKAMRAITLRRIYQVLGVLGVLLLCIYITLAAIFVVCAITIAYENLVSMSAGMVFVIGLWIWTLAVYALCGHLLLDTWHLRHRSLLAH